MITGYAPLKERSSMRIIDVHTHGFGGHDSKGAKPEDLLGMARLQGELGVDAIVITIYSSSLDEMRADMSAVKRAMESQQERRPECSGQKQAAIIGAHLEGPFLNPAMAGALDRGSFLPATVSNCERLIEGFDKVARIMTVAPELEGATKLIRAVAGRGIIVSMGHSDATFSEAQDGFNAGAAGITHLFNAMRGIHHREPGIAGFGLTNPHVYTEVIADPYHLHPGALEIIFRMKDRMRIILVSDTVKGSGIAGSSGVRSASGRLLGGSMALTESMKRLVELGFDRDIVEAAACENPGRYLGL